MRYIKMDWTFEKQILKKWRGAAVIMISALQKIEAIFIGTEQLGE